jgi:hypothetical protein
MGSATPQDSWNDKNLDFTLRFGRVTRAFYGKAQSIDTPTLTFLQSHLSPNDSEITGYNAFRNLLQSSRRFKSEVQQGVQTCGVQNGLPVGR